MGASLQRITCEQVDAPLRRETGEAAGEHGFGGVVAKVLGGDLKVLTRDRVPVGFVFEQPEHGLHRLGRDRVVDLDPESRRKRWL